MGFCNGSILNVYRKMHIVLPDVIVRMPATSLKFLCRIGGGGLDPVELERLGLGLGLRSSEDTDTKWPAGTCGGEIWRQ